MDAQTIAKLLKSSQVSQFSDIALARSFCDRCDKLHLMILGDNGKVWVATPRITERLHNAGYDYAE